MKTTDELWELLRQSGQMPYGAARTALIEEVLRHVEAVADPDLSFTTRLLATSAYIYGGEPVKAFPTFSWCVADFDNRPGPHHRRWAHTLLWDFKAMVSGLTRFPEIPLDRTYRVLDDMERRYREGGHSLQAVYKRRQLVARHLGDIEREDEWFERWQAAERDDLSDCAGCDPTSVVVYLSTRGRHEEAVALAEPVLAGELSCNEQPQSILTELMLPYLQTGRLAEAVDAHRRAYRVHRSRLADLGDIGWHMAFCARTGNEHRGLEILQRHLDWLDRAPSPFTAMSFATYGSHVLRRITALGHGDATVRRKDRDDSTAAELAEELAAMATGIAARFDARNGTDAQARWVAEQLDAEPYGVDLILDPAARQTRPAPLPARAPEPAPEIPAQWSVEELLDLAEEHHRAERDEAFAGVVDALEKRAATDDPLLEARRLRALGYRAATTERDEALGLWSSAADRFAAAGAAGEASALRARVALERAYAGEVGEVDEAPIRDNVADQEQHGDTRERAIAHARLAMLHLLRGEAVEANDAGDRGDDYAAQTGDPRLIAVHAMMRARNRAAADRDEEAVAAAREGYAFYREHGPARRLAEAATVLAHAVADPAERVELFGAVLDTRDPDQALAARVGRGHALKRLNRPGEAVVDLAEAVALCAEHGLERGGAFARHELAEAYAQDERTVEAVEVAEEALLFFDRAEEHRAAANTRYLLAQQYRRLGDTDAALARYRELIERLTDNPLGRAQMGEEAGVLLFELDRDADAAEAFAAAATCLHDAGDLVAELRLLRRRVAALHFADEVEAAEEAIGLADQRWADLPTDLAAEPEAIWHHGMTMWEAGRVLMSRGRYAEALPHLHGADTPLRAIGATDDADHLAGMYGEALLRSGSPAEAEPVVRELLDRMAPDAPGRESAEKVYAEIVEALGTS
ncbi:tetratricopeptide repeat protein [Actinoplanes sp. KI2]|uniref:tetratricopeptide repeat protein n=1 Tax=Actinoplanes sp. KI2 TaxID=2983315 RepID=UPI0021D5F1EB|nr:tetratricopeptide repeat protein [Actinoplanes sp. KI2]MCU7729784.1 tetratricopeptide repeat protein [Actinoplanes sp. KI2]